MIPTSVRPGSNFTFWQVSSVHQYRSPCRTGEGGGGVRITGEKSLLRTHGGGKELKRAATILRDKAVTHHTRVRATVFT